MKGNHCVTDFSLIKIKDSNMCYNGRGGYELRALRFRQFVLAVLLWGKEVGGGGIYPFIPGFPYIIQSLIQIHWPSFQYAITHVHYKKSNI